MSTIAPNPTGQLRMPRASINETFAAALDVLVEQIKEDRSILAVILCGSLAHDTVWAKSDIDLALITIDDKKIDREGISLSANGINVHAFVMSRTEFRKVVEGTIRNWFMHSLLAKGRLVYSHDDTIAGLFAGLTEIGERDRRLALLHAGTAALPPIYKAHKWLITRGDLDYTALWILYAATPLARIELLEAHLLADREVIPQAMKVNPSFFKIVYTDLLNAKKTRKSVEGALAAVDRYVADRARSLFALVFDYLRDAGDVRSCTEIEDHFARHFAIPGVTTACEYLADEGLIGKAAATTRLTKRSNIDIQEMAFFAHD
jgi:hypothetical protein